MKRYFLILLIVSIPLSCVRVPTPTPLPPVPNVIVTEVISFDENEQNAGILDFINGRGWIITPNAAKKYLALIKSYGKIFMPPLESKGGLEPYGKNFLLSQEKMIKFAQMNQRWKADRK